MVDHKMMIHELAVKLGFDNMRALVKANPITEEQGAVRIRASPKVGFAL